ncbi:MAG: DUF1492 domain-containing protein [Tissierellaceae bacterium]
MVEQKDTVYPLDLENEVNTDIDKLISFKKEIIENINQADDYTLRLVLAMRYINHKSWEDIADDLLYDVRTIYRFHKQGLKEIEKILLNKKGIN